MNKCPVCGTEYEGTFCPKGCNSAAFQQPTPTKKKKRGCLIAILAVVGVAVLAIIAIVIWAVVDFAKDPEASMSSYYAMSSQRAAESALAAQAKAESDANASAAASRKQAEREQAESKARVESEAAAQAAAEQQKEEFIASCQSIAYKDLARNPDSYKGQTFKFIGEVIQVMESDHILSDTTTVTLRVNVTKDEYGWWEDTILATVDIPKSADRILEEDIITIYGTCQGQQSYETILGATTTLPKIEIKYYGISNS